MKPHPVLLPIDAVRTDGGTQIRAELNPFLIDDYAAAVQTGAVFPPVVVFSDSTDYWLADGIHRLAAGREAGLTEISADVRSGTRREAVLFAVGANASHGLRRTNADEHRAVLLLLEDEEWRHWSDREIARVAVVSHEFVRTQRARLSVNRCQMGERTVRRGTTTYSMSTSGIGTTQRLALEVRDLLRDTPIAEDRTELHILVRLAPEEQRDVASWIASGAAPTVKSAVKAVEARRREVQTREAEALLAGSVAPGRVIRPGEWCCLGRHRLYCGDTSDEAFFSPLPKAEFAFADPPYNAGVAQWDSNFEWKHDWLIEQAEVVAITPGIAALCDFARTTAMPYRWTVASWITNGMTRGELGFGNWIAVLLFSHERLFRGVQDLVRVSIRTSESRVGLRNKCPPGGKFPMANTLYEPGNAEFSDIAHRAAQRLIYPRMFGVVEEQITYEDVRIDADTTNERYRILDGEMGVDRIATITHPLLEASLSFHVQERFRKPEHAGRRDVTITEWNHASNRRSEFYKISAGYFLYAYYDEAVDRFLDAIVFNVDDLKLAVIQGRVEYERGWYRKKNQTFLVFTFAELRRIGVVRYHQEQEGISGRRLLVDPRILAEPRHSPLS
jgi:hypothetical protein